MAIYQRDFYGLSYYGTDQPVASVEPFTAVPVAFNNLRVTWDVPASSSSWTRMQLLRSRAGFCATPEDGEVVIDVTSNFPDSYTDTGLAGGWWYYYTIFAYTQSSISVAPVYNRVGVTSGLSVGDTGTTYAMWKKVPDYFEIVRNSGSSITDDYAGVYNVPWNTDQPSNTIYAFNPDQFDQPNQTLQAFLSVLGFGADIVRNYQNTLMDVNDPHKTHVANLASLAAEVGVDFEYEIPASVMRKKVANAALLARQRGTLAGLQNLASLSTGWDVDVYLTQNLFLTAESSEFISPSFPDWDPGVNYAVGAIVQYLGDVWKCVTAAMGSSESPPTPPTTSNTWWTQLSDVDVTTLTDHTGTAYAYPSSWMKVISGASSNPVLSVGNSSQASADGSASNSLRLKNTAASTQNIDVYGTPQTSGEATPTQANVIAAGIPVPTGYPWSSTTEYQIGSLVTYNGKLYQALARNLNKTPQFHTTYYWQQVGFDSRPRLGYSFYTHGPLTGTSGTGGVTTVASVACYNATGTLLTDFTGSAVNVLWDSFNSGTHFTADHTIDINMPHGSAWTVQSGSFDLGPDDDNQYQVLNAYSTGITTTSWYPPNDVTGTYYVAVTFDGSRYVGYKQALIFYLTAATTYYRVTRTGIDSVSSGTPTSLATFASPIADNTRVVLQLSTSNSTATVLVNGSSIGSATITAPAAASGFGVGVLAS